LLSLTAEGPFRQEGKEVDSHQLAGFDLDSPWGQADINRVDELDGWLVATAV
jgi:hypothetical protein